MGCTRSRSSVLLPRIALLFCCLLLSPLSVVASPSGTASAEERAPARGGSIASTREQQGGVAEAARIVAERLAAAFPRVAGLIIGFEGDLVLIDRGTADGVVQGMELEVFREGEAFQHPLTGEFLGRLDKDLGRIRVLRVRERYAEATIIKKAEKAGFRKGDRVRVSMARIIAAFPNVDVAGVSGASARSITKELAATVVRTGRFELIEERQLRSILSTEKELKAEEWADPHILKQLADKGKVQALLLSRLTPSADGVSLDVQAYSALTGHSIVLASALIQPGVTTYDKSSRRPQPPPVARPSVITSPQISKPAASDGPVSGRVPSASMLSEQVVLEPALDGPTTAVVAADLDGDGKSELLVAAADRLLAFRFDGSHLRSLTEYPWGGKDAVVALEAMDVTGDGGAEVVLTLSYKDRFRALILQWVDGKLRRIGEMPDLILRPLSVNRKTVQLFGQARTPGERAAQPIHQYTWDGRNVHAGPALDVPAGLSLLEFMLADLGGDGAVRLVTFKGGSALEVRSRTGELIATYQESRGMMAPTNRVGRRVLLEYDGERPRVILAQAQEADNRLLSWWSGGKTAGVAVLEWDGARFQEVRQAPIADGTLVDYAVADLGDGVGRRLLTLVVKSGRLGWGTKSEIHAFRIR